MKTIKEITLDEKRRLYELAISLKELKPWEWMWDGDVFGVEDPQTGEIGYCCVMGRRVPAPITLECCWPWTEIPG